MAVLAKNLHFFFYNYDKQNVKKSSWREMMKNLFFTWYFLYFSSSSFPQYFLLLLVQNHYYKIHEEKRPNIAIPFKLLLAEDIFPFSLWQFQMLSSFHLYKRWTKILIMIIMIIFHFVLFQTNILSTEIYMKENLKSFSFA